MSGTTPRFADGAGAAFLRMDDGTDLPLWAQALMASRLTRRAVLAMVGDNKLAVADRDVLIAGCDAIDRCAALGQYREAEGELIRSAVAWVPTRRADSLAQAMYWAADAALAANDASDFSAAETACMNSTKQAIAHAAQSPGMNPLQARMYIAGDIDLLRFACGEFRVGRYDALGQVMGRLTTIA